MKSLTILKKSLNNIGHHKTGYCNICGNLTVFLCIDTEAVRNNMYCLFCQSSARKRHVAKMLLQSVNSVESSISHSSQVKKLNIYSADIDESFYKVLGDRNSFVCSGFIPGVELGSEIRERVFCQNLEQLTFSDETFDIVITEDVFEHIRHPKKAFQEVYRVLKPGGYHIFTIPFYFDRHTVERINTSTEEDIHLLPAEYHGDKIRGGIIVYTDFGIDLYDSLRLVGFQTVVDFCNYSDRRHAIFSSYVFVSQKSDESVGSTEQTGAKQDEESI